jgi:hypothetical protein
MTTYFEEIGSIFCMTSGFRSETTENWALLSCYAPSGGNFLLTFIGFILRVQEFVRIHAP